MLDLLNKRNCPVYGGMLKCKNSDYAKPFREKELFFKCDMAMRQLWS